MKNITGIKGFLGTSLIDFPNEVASVLFLGGCNLNCDFCHNTELVFNVHHLPDLDFGLILNTLQENRKMLDGVVITGGEPTIHPDLLAIAKEIKALKMKVKIDTNGMRPDVIKSLIKENFVDYIAMDLKTSPDNYFSLGAGEDAAEIITESVTFLKSQKKVKYELRTTFVPKYVNEKTFARMKELINGVGFYYLQATLDVDRTKMRSFANLVREHCEVKNFGIRNM